jgi:hypothetical protein
MHRARTPMKDLCCARLPQRFIARDRARPGARRRSAGRCRCTPHPPLSEGIVRRRLRRRASAGTVAFPRRRRSGRVGECEARLGSGDLRSSRGRRQNPGSWKANPGAAPQRLQADGGGPSAAQAVSARLTPVNDGEGASAMGADIAAAMTEPPRRITRGELPVVMGRLIDQVDDPVVGRAQENPVAPNEAKGLGTAAPATRSCPSARLASAAQAAIDHRYDPGGTFGNPTALAT